MYLNIWVLPLSHLPLASVNCCRLLNAGRRGRPKGNMLKVMGKGNKERSLPLNGTIKEALDRLIIVSGSGISRGTLKIVSGKVYYPL